MAAILVNTRNITAPLTGVQRYTVEMLRELADEVAPAGPWLNLRGKLGHLWEQTVLPSKVYGRLLWSPGNTGPLAVRNQVVTVHDLAMFDQAQCYRDGFGHWYRWLMPRLVRRVRAVIVNSRFTRDRLLALTDIEPGRVHVVHLGVCSHFRPNAGRAPNLPFRRYILCLGSLEPRKNLPRLLHAWQAIAPSLDPELGLVLAGGEGSRLIYPEQALPLPPRTCAIGRVPESELPGLLSNATAFAYPSLYEGFGLPPLEAMASGVPVLSSHAGALAETLGDAALLIDPHDVGAIAAGIRMIAMDQSLRQTLRHRGFEQSKRFQWRACAQATKAVFAQVLETQSTDAPALDHHDPLADRRTHTPDHGVPRALLKVLDRRRAA